MKNYFFKLGVLILFVLTFSICNAELADDPTVIMLENIANGADQVIIATPGAEPYLAVVRAFTKEAEGWRQVLITDGFFGRTGIKEDKREGDGATPKGVFTFGRAFGIADDPGSVLPYTQITDNDIWVDDSNSSRYNQWAAKDDPEADWGSAEILADYPVQYQYVLSINYNTDPPVPGLGSAIFLHCKTDRPTAGCISVSEEAMLFFLQYVDEKTLIVIMEN